VVAPYHSTRKKRPEPPPGEDLFAQADRKAMEAEKAAADAREEAEEGPNSKQLEIVEHTTKKGKTLRGIIRRDLTGDQASTIDPYTFRKDGGWFIREKHLDGAATPTATKPVEKPESPADPKPIPEPKSQKTGRADKFRKMADDMEDQIQAKLNPAIGNQNVTARRARIAGHIMAEGEHLQETQAYLRAIADHIDAGTLPPILDKISSRADIEFLRLSAIPRLGWDPLSFDSRDLLDKIKGMKGTAESRVFLQNYAAPLGENVVQHIKILLDKTTLKVPYLRDKVKTWERAHRLGLTNGGEYDGTALNPQKYKDAQAALKSVMKEKPAPRADVKIKELESKLIGLKIPGYFPTPRAVVDKMLEIAGIRPGMTVLEPSAGKGNIADAIRETAPDANLSVAEYSQTLQEILRAKGFNLVGDDFLDHRGEYDRIVMNPPFEKNQDIRHVKHAYDLIKPGGKLIAIMSEHPFFGTDKESAEFRDWLETRGTSTKLNSGDLADKSVTQRSNVVGRMVTISKPAIAKAWRPRYLFLKAAA